MTQDMVHLSACPACGSDRLSTEIGDVRPNLEQVPGCYSFSRCGACALVFTNPRPAPGALAALYDLLPGGQHYDGGGAALPGRLSWSNIADPSYRKILKWLPPGSILDVGCGQGALMQVIRDAGHDVQGVDFSESSRQAGEGRGLDIRCADLNTFTPEPSRYDGIVMRHVLEHIEDPVGLLRRLADGLRPRGRVVIEVPNFDSVSRSLFGASWNGWDPPFHVNQFSRGALSAALDAAGFRDIAVTTFGVVDEARRSYGRLRGREARYDALRIAALPLYKMAGVVGRGSSLLVRATAG